MRQIGLIKYFLLTLIGLTPIICSGQHLDSLVVITQINTVGKPYLEVQIDLRLPEIKLIDDSFDLGQEFELVSDFENKTSQGDVVKQRLGISRSKILVIFDNLNKDFIGAMVEGKSVAFLNFADDLFVPIFDTVSKQVKPFVIPRDRAKALTFNRIKLTGDQSQRLIESLGGGFGLPENRLGFGYSPKDQSATNRAEFYFNFNYRSGYNFISNKNLFFYSEGQLSTNSRDSLNYLNIYPVNYRLFKKKSEIITRLGLESNQRLTSYRVAVNAYWQGLLPNLIDLSFNQNRLRLKPILKLGTKFYQEIDNARLEPDNNKKFSNQLFGELFYYIPVMNIYSIVLETGAFYDFNDQLNTGQEVKFNYKITFGLEIPNTDFKTIFSYQNGANDINFENARLLLIGLSADLFGTR